MMKHELHDYVAYPVKCGITPLTGYKNMKIMETEDRFDNVQWNPLCNENFFFRFQLKPK